MKSMMKRTLFALLNLAATVQVVWFYLSTVPSYLNLERYELGLEKTPFQHRLLMTVPLKWAHRSEFMNVTARHLSQLTSWFPRGMRPEALLEAPIDLVCVVTTGVVAYHLYAAASRTRMLLAFVYPLTLVMITATYSMNTFHRMRFIYDLPSLAFFSLGIYLIYFRSSKWLFVLLFVVATVNRETTLFLLMFYLLQEYQVAAFLPGWNRILAVLRGSWIVLPLALLWLGWHRWVEAHFASNQSEAGPRFWLNVGTFLWPCSWPQLLSTFAFCVPACILYRRQVRDKTLRIWQAVVPVWFVVMMRYGLFVEIRIFGELIPLFACSAALIAEHSISDRVTSDRSAPAIQ